MKTSLMMFAILLIFNSCDNNNEAQAPPIQEFPCIQVIEEEVEIHQEYVGQVYGLFDIPVRARVEGFLEGIHFREGFKVKSGDLLYHIESEPYLAQSASVQSQLAAAQTELVRANNELNRIEPLAEMNAVSQSELDGAIAQKQAAEAQVKAAEANVELSKIQLSYTDIKAPISGIIGKTEAKVGEFVGRDPNPVILNTISRIDTVRVEFFLTENDYLFIARRFNAFIKDYKPGDGEGQKGNLELVLADESVHEYKGSVNFIDREIDPSTGSILVEAAFPNPDLIVRPGQFAKVRIKQKGEEPSLLIPQRCVREIQGSYSVFVVNSDNIIESRQVEMGPRVQDHWVVLSGVEKGETIVYEGVQKVKSGMEIKVLNTEIDSEFLNSLKQ